MNDIGALLAATREVAAAKIAPEASRVDRERAFPADELRALGEAGALGLVVPAEHGGAGGALAALAEACEAVGAACASTGMVFLMHEVTAATIAAGGGERAAELLPTARVRRARSGRSRSASAAPARTSTTRS